MAGTFPIERRAVRLLRSPFLTSTSTTSSSIQLRIFSPTHSPHLLHRNASSSTSKPPNYPKGAPIPLEKPDKFRPPSHGAKVSPRRAPPPLNYPGPPQSQDELEAQKTKRYPHMFPPEGTFMHWFLNNRTLHLFITMGTLTVLAISTMIIHFRATSPYADLLPPLSLLPFHPYQYMHDWLSTYRLHVEYTSHEAAKARSEKILDAQKRRLYRRAHGMEDLDAEEGQGVDVRGLVDWDDGLTRPEREGLRRQRAVERGEDPDAIVEGGEVVVRQERPKVKRWLGIWS